MPKDVKGGEAGEAPAKKTAQQKLIERQRALKAAEDQAEEEEAESQEEGGEKDEAETEAAEEAEAPAEEAPKKKKSAKNAAPAAPLGADGKVPDKVVKPGKPTPKEKEPEEAKPEYKVVEGKGGTRVLFENSPHQMHPDVERLNIPRQTSEEYAALREDIKRSEKIHDAVRVSRHPITKQIYVVDGWHRLHIGDELDIEAPREFIDWDKAAEYAISASTRRSLDTTTRAAMAVEMLEIEKERRERIKKEKSAQKRRIANADKPEILTVSFENLSPGGTVFDANSESTIMVRTSTQNSKLSGIVTVEKKGYAITRVEQGRLAEAYKLVQPDDFKGVVTNYAARAQEWANGQQELGYDGVVVTYKGNTWVLQGPPLFLAVEDITDDEVFGAESADAEGEGQAEAGSTEKIKGRATQRVADQVGGISASSVDRMAQIKKKDRAAYDRIVAQENIPDTNRRETTTSAWNRILEKEGKAPVGGSKKAAISNPDEVTLAEFTESLPIYETLKNNPKFHEAIRFWNWTREGLKNFADIVKRAAVGKALQDDDYTKKAKEVCATPHPSEWKLCPKCDGGGAVSSDTGRAQDGNGNMVECSSCYGAGFKTR